MTVALPIKRLRTLGRPPLLLLSVGRWAFLLRQGSGGQVSVRVSISFFHSVFDVRRSAFDVLPSPSLPFSSRRISQPDCLIMNKRSLLTLTIAILCFDSALAQSPSPSPSPNNANAIRSPSAAPDAAELTQLLKDFLAGASKNDPAVHERFWAENLIYTSSSGKRMGKADILRDVKNENSTNTDPEQTTFTAEDIRIQQYDTTAIVAFRLVGTTVKDNKTEKTYYLNTGTFLKRDNLWQVVAWQATKMGEK